MLLVSAFEEVDHMMLRNRDHLLKRLIILVHVLDILKGILATVPIIGNYGANSVNQLE